MIMKAFTQLIIKKYDLKNKCKNVQHRKLTKKKHGKRIRTYCLVLKRLMTHGLFLLRN